MTYKVVKLERGIDYTTTDEITTSTHTSETETLLNKLGESGWELVNVVRDQNNGIACFFKKA